MRMFFLGLLVIFSFFVSVVGASTSVQPVVFSSVIVSDNGVVTGDCVLSPNNRTVFCNGAKAFVGDVLLVRVFVSNKSNVVRSVTAISSGENLVVSPSSISSDIQGKEKFEFDFMAKTMSVGMATITISVLSSE